jgi:sulfotransferase family protein
MDIQATSDFGRPVFIVGAPRSGTTMLAALLGAHSWFACGPETHFFNKIKPNQFDSATSDREWPRKATELIMSLTLAHQRVADLYEFSAHELNTFLASRPRTIASMVEALTEQYAARNGKRRWAEKTPNHLLHLRQLRSAFPEAQVIRIIRDPRDSAASMRGLPEGSDSILANAFAWHEWHRQSRDFFDIDQNHITVHYEDLVLQPETTLKELCRFLSVPFELTMLETSISGAAVSSKHEPWKTRAAQRLDASRVQAWKRTLPSNTRRAVDFVCLEGMLEFGYPIPEAPRSTEAVFPVSAPNVKPHEELFQQRAASGVRLLPVTNIISAPRLNVLTNLTGTPWAKLTVYVRLAAGLTVRRILGRPTHVHCGRHQYRQRPIRRLAEYVLKCLARPAQ